MTNVLPDVGALSAEQRAVYETFPFNLTRGLVLTRASAAPYLALGGSFREGWLPAADRELVILRVGAATAADYELFHHIPQARGLGVPDVTIDRVVAGGTVGDDATDALLRFVDELVDGVRLPAPPLANVSKYYPNEQVAEIVLLVGHYVMTAMFVKALGIQPDDAPAGEEAR